MSVPNFHDIQERLKKSWGIIKKESKNAYDKIIGLNPYARDALIAGVSVTSFLFMRKIFKYSFRQVKTENDLSPKDFKRKMKLRGVVMNVSDSDNLRVLHQPLFIRLMNKLPLLRKSKSLKLSESTIHIRLAGIDAPECAHFGSPGQPFAIEAKQWLTDYCLNRKVIIQVLRRDQYARAVATAWVYRPISDNLIIQFICGTLLLGYWTWFWKNVSLEMLKAGYAVVYDKRGSEYGVGMKKDLFLKYEMAAKKKKKGMWVQKKFVSPAEYKQKHKK